VEAPAIPWESSWPQPPPLAHGEVHVLRMSVPQDPKVVSHLETSLSRTENERAAAYHFDEDRQRHIVARGGLRLALAHHLASAPGELRFRVNAYGKPLLFDSSGPDGIRFNVSHSGAFVLLVLARGRRVGIDVEQIREDVPHLDMAARFFSTQEYDALVAQSLRRRVAFFFATWTRKEAYVKGRGRGLSIPTQEFSVEVSGTEPLRVDDRDCISRPGRWRVTGIETAEGYAAAIAVEGSRWRVRCFDADEALRAAAGA
jgi:4'-phosphopantetheinyl transferase